MTPPIPPALSYTRSDWPSELLTLEEVTTGIGQNWQIALPYVRDLLIAIFLLLAVYTAVMEGDLGLCVINTLMMFMAPITINSVLERNSAYQLYNDVEGQGLLRSGSRLKRERDRLIAQYGHPGHAGCRMRWSHLIAEVQGVADSQARRVDELKAPTSSSSSSQAS